MSDYEIEIAKKYGFDLYGRYKIPSTIINLNRQPGQKVSILDVGGRGNILKDFLYEDDVYYLDPNIKSNEVNFIEGDGCHIPRGDDFFDWVISCDVFEHVEENQRIDFLIENLRVAKEGVILAAPFFTPKIKKAEEEVNAFYYQLYGQNHPWLIEHIVNGLPSLQETVNFFKKINFSCEIIRNNRLDLWTILQKISLTTNAQSDKLNFYYNNNIYPKDVVWNDLVDNNEYYRTVLYIKKNKRAADIGNKMTIFKGHVGEIEKIETLETYITDALKLLAAKVVKSDAQIAVLLTDSSKLHSIYSSKKWKFITFLSMVSVSFGAFFKKSIVLCNQVLQSLWFSVKRYLKQMLTWLSVILSIIKASLAFFIAAVNYFIRRPISICKVWDVFVLEGWSGIYRRLTLSTEKDNKIQKAFLAQCFAKLKLPWLTFLLAKNYTGGIKNIFKKTLITLKNDGIKGVVHRVRKYAYYANYLNESLTEQPQYIEIYKSKFRSTTSILFVGHDANLAGAQVLLLNLVKWFNEHTNITVKIILLQPGILLNKYQAIAPVLLWNNFLYGCRNIKERKAKLLEFIGRVDLIYGNTVLAPAIYDELVFLGAPFITHVHELEKTIKMYIEKSTIEKMRLFTQKFIAGSNPVALNLIHNHSINEKNILVVNDFIEKRNLTFDIAKNNLRKKMGLVENAMIVFGCGTIHWRKGVDLFVETALLLKQKGYSNFHFYWIGENVWDLDRFSRKICLWSEIEQKIINCQLENHITFLEVKDNLSDYFMAGDVFYLSSREDPFPLVCLEAAQCGIPTICFKGAGGMPDFVENDAGFVVSNEDINEVADKIILLASHRELLNKLGTTAKAKFLARHSIDIAAPEILNFCRKVGNFSPLVSIIVPNYNCEKFLAKRLDSIINQTFKNFEIIILDDASTDQSLKVIEKYLHLPFVKLIKCQVNSGSPFIQWHKGFLEAKGEFIWFAEADDFCEPDLLQKLLPNFNKADIALAYCNSLMVNQSDNVIGDYNNYLNQLDPHHWQSSYQVTDVQEINFGLGIKNSIPNASAVLIRKSCISDTIFKTIFQFKFSGDWFFYMQVIRGHSVAFCAEKLNYHRKHDQTVSLKFNTDKSAIPQLLKEAELTHLKILDSYDIDANFLNKWSAYISEQILVFYPHAAKQEFNKYYSYNLIEEKIKKRIVENENIKKLVFITTNDGASNGGSEQLWIETALECRKRGCDVMVFIKKWDPVPYFIQLFYDNGVKVNFKGYGDFEHVLLFKPNLLIISTGDQDDGIEWYQKCRIHNVPYVIINQLTKEPKYWPIRVDINEQVKEGYLNATRVFFTCNNNREVMEKRINCQISHTDIHYNPFHIDRNIVIPFPPLNDCLKIAIPANLLRVHKGQHLAIELFNFKKWRDRPIQLNLYGKGADEEILKAMVEKYQLKNVFFHQHAGDLLTIWRNNHAILMPSFMEGLPIVLVGAMLCARVPVLTNIGAHGELINDNVNGFIAQQPTVKSLDDALERAYQQLANWEDIGQKAREKILSIIPKDPVDDFISKITSLISTREV